MTPLLIALTGAAGSGKDSFAEALRGEGFAIVAHSDPIKVVARDVWGCDPDDLWGPSERRAVAVAGAWTFRCGRCGSMRPARGEGDESNCGQCGTIVRAEPLTIRALLQYLGTEIGRGIAPGCWIRAMDRRLTRLLAAWAGFVDDAGRLRWDWRDPTGTYWPSQSVLPAWTRIAGVVVTDARFGNEAIALRYRGAVVVRLVRGDGWPRVDGPPGGIAGHSSEAGVDSALVDEEIVVPFLEEDRRAAFWEGIVIDFLRRRRKTT